MSITVFYHDNCPDGLASVAILTRVFGSLMEAVPVDYDRDLPQEHHTDVYMVDFTHPDIEQMRAMIQRATRVIHLDHHEGAREIVDTLKGENYPHYQPTFDTTRSGAGLTWSHFHPDMELPPMVKYVEDRDLWQFNYPETRAYVQGLCHPSLSINRVMAALEGELTPDSLITLGQALMAQRQKDIASRLETTLTEVSIDTPDGIDAIPLSWAPDKTWVSDQMEAMLMDYPATTIGACAYPHGDGYRIRLGSKKEGPSVIPLAQFYGGGGHPHASGITVTRDHSLFSVLIMNLPTELYREHR